MSDLVPEWATYPWFHSIDLGDGRVTKGVKSLSQIGTEERLFYDGVDLSNADVIDIGAWNGAFTFAASRRGARRVLAADSFAWTHSHFRGKEAFDFANATLRLPNIETKTIEVHEICPESVGQYDVCLFAGVLYHLPSPLEGLENAASVARECLIVETQSELNDLERPAMVYYPGASLNNDDSNYFGQNVSFLTVTLREFGFTQFDVYFYGRERVVLHAWRSAARRKFRGRGPVEFHSTMPVSRYEQLQKENQKLEAQISKIEASRSWKLTAPLRRLSHTLGLAK